MKKANIRQIGWAAVGVTVGMVLYHNLRSLTRNNAVGRLMDGSLVRSA